MPTQSESSATVSGTSSKTLQLLRKRLRQLLRVMLVLTICLAVAATTLAIRWLTSLNGLPDIGDPFDVAAFRTFRLPDDQNAFTYFRRAWKAAEPVYGGGWSETNPEFRAFVEANRPAVELFIKGAEQPDGISGPVGEPLPGENNSDLDAAYPLQASSWGLIGMTLMEGGLREERGDMTGAWDCYRAVLRMMAHVRRRERLKDRVRVTLWLPVLQKHLATWAADPRTTNHQVRRALEDVVECRPMPEWDAFTLKIEYLDLMRFLDRRVVPPPGQIEEEWTYRLGDMQLPFDLSLGLYQVKRGLARARAQPACHSIALRQLARAGGAPRATQAGGSSALPHRKARERPVAVSRQPRHAGGRVRSVAAGGGQLAGHDQRRQAGVQVWVPFVACRSPDGTAQLSRVARTTGRRDLSPRARRTAAFRGSPGRDLSQELARRRLGRPGRRDDAERRVADRDA